MTKSPAAARSRVDSCKRYPDSYPVTADVKTVKRVGTTRNGDPTYRITTPDGRSWLTYPGPMVGDVATTFRGRMCRLTITAGRVARMAQPEY